jgi:hypothetical protein
LGIQKYKTFAVFQSEMFQQLLKTFGSTEYDMFLFRRKSVLLLRLLKNGKNN